MGDWMVAVTHLVTFTWSFRPLHGKLHMWSNRSFQKISAAVGLHTATANGRATSADRSAGGPRSLFCRLELAAP
ncbi:hypothetical protein MPLDJ20_110079 [Mesorhizobium plurifarium]|uniref:Uncharacterized protein n=1 Tax=Mesorhizobium plurifarium TaxID=69974 RepID=A0A090DS76_MESPL|nr:hypothetical protein MPLDJ20_110079 [Mesorhizobium plurifarium]